MTPAILAGARAEVEPRRAPDEGAGALCQGIQSTPTPLVAFSPVWHGPNSSDERDATW
jgi:hypothetical protein